MEEEKLEKGICECKTEVNRPALVGFYHLYSELSLIPAYRLLYHNYALQKLKVKAQFASKQILHFGFAKHKILA